MSLGKVIKSISDKRIYKPLCLKNDLQCLIISDKDAQKSGAALSVGVGSFLDPIQAQGIAHYLEHMLFMGTAKYPEENEYSNTKFLSKNAGSSNAYTSLDETNYFFETSHGSFIDALDRFSRFFIDPLMLDSSSERELNAVHSEHSKNLQSDMWRKYQLSKFLAKPGHPYNKFSTGDRNSLSNPNLREMLFNFYNTHYSANLMKLVIYGQSDVDALAKEVESRFQQVINKNYSKFQLKEHPYDQKTIGKLLKYVPVKDNRTLQLTWVLSDQSQHYKYSPSKYLSHVLGHEGKGSLLSFLIAEDLATGLSAGGTDSYECFSEFQISVSLTDKGLKSIRQIIGYIFFFINKLKASEPQEWVIDQIKRVNKMKFDYLEKRQGMNYCSNIAKNLHRRKLQEVLVYPFFMQEFKPQLISEYINQISTENLSITVVSKDFQHECTQVEPIYQSKFKTEPIGSIDSKQCQVTLPSHNPFIPNDLTILPLGQALYPRKIYNTEYIQAFFKEDHEFALPKAQINLRIYFSGSNTVKEQIVRSLFQRMLNEKLREFVYMADMADLDSEFSFSSYFTLGISITGFRDSFDRFTSQYLKEILEFSPNDKQLFLTLKEKQKKEYANYFLNNPYQLAYNTIVNALRQGSSTPPIERLEIVDSIQLEDLVSFANNWKKRVYLEFYMTGNLIEEHAGRIAKDIQAFVKTHSSALPKSAIGTIRPIFLPINKVCAVEEVLKSKKQTNNSIIVHYQYQASSLQTKILQEIALSFVKQPAFDYLRTKEQLGYIVMCLPDDHRGVLGMSILVQSNIKNSYELQKYVHKFVNEILRQKIDKLDDKTFEEYKAALQNTKKQKDRTLGSEAARFWGEIVRHSYEFNRKEREIDTIPKTTLLEFKQFLHSLFYENTRVFEMHQISQSQLIQSAEMRAERQRNEPNFKIYSDVETFRKKMPLYPDHYSHL